MPDIAVRRKREERGEREREGGKKLLLCIIKQLFKSSELLNIC